MIDMENKNCMNCIYCDACEGCIGCDACKDCIGCDACEDCINCSGLRGEKGLRNVHR